MIVGESSFYEIVYGSRLVYGRIGSKKSQHKLKEYLSGKVKAKTEWHTLDFNKWIENFSNLRGNNYMDLYFALMLTFAQSVDSSNNDNLYIGDKNPSDIDYIKYLLHSFPNAKIINIIRDGKAVVASMLSSNVGPNNVIDAALIWKRYMRVTKRLDKKILPFNYLRISYEEMLRNPGKILNIVCNFLGIPFQQKMLKANLSGLSSFTNSNERCIDKTRIFRYKNTLTRDQITLIEYIAEDELKEYGYLSKEEISVSLASIKLKFFISVRKIILIVKEFLKKYHILIGLKGLRSQCREALLNWLTK